MLPAPSPSCVDHGRLHSGHYSVYVAEVGCKKAAAANVESVFSGAGKFTQEAKSAGHMLLSRMVRLHYNWKYLFLRPTIEEVVKRYLEKFHKKEAAAPVACAAAFGGRGKLVCRRARRPDRDPNRRGSLNSNSPSCDTDPVASQWSS